MKKQKNKKIGRPNWFLYGLVFRFLYPIYRRKYGLEIDRAAWQGVTGPALVIAPHTSNKDHWLVGMALYPTRPTFVISEHFMAKPRLRPLLHAAHVVTKKMFCPDVGTIMNILRARREGNVVVLFPEGRLSCHGRTGTVADGTAALARRLGVDVYVVTANGASCTFPKWAKRPRHGKICVTVEKLLDGQDLPAMTEEAIEARMQQVISHDDFAAMAGVPYRAKGMAEGLDGILYRCPACGEEFCLMGEGDHLRCSHCGLDATLDAYYHFTGAPLPDVATWYDWQAAQLDLGQPLTTHARIGAVDKKGNMDPYAGEADITMDADTFTFKGTVFGKDVTFCRKTVDIGGFPVTVGQEFDIYYNNTLYYMYPQPDQRACVKWVAYLDRVMEQARAGLLSGAPHT